MTNLELGVKNSRAENLTAARTHIKDVLQTTCNRIKTGEAKINSSII